MVKFVAILALAAAALAGAAQASGPTLSVAATTNEYSVAASTIIRFEDTGRDPTASLDLFAPAGFSVNVDQPIGATIGTLDAHVTTATVAELRVAGLIKNADPAATVAAAAACTPRPSVPRRRLDRESQLGRNAGRAAHALRRPGGRGAIHGLLRAGARLLRRPGDDGIPPVARHPDAERPLCEPGRRRRVPLDDDPAHTFSGAVRARPKPDDRQPPAEADDRAKGDPAARPPAAGPSSGCPAPSRRMDAESPACACRCSEGRARRR